MRATRWLATAAVLLLPAILAAQDPANFSTSLHATRQGKATWYSAANGGFEMLTQIPIADLGCLKCHPGTYANGTEVDPATYQPGCNDCHNRPNTTVSQDQCLKCHGRQKTEMMKMQFADVHRDVGFTCTDCHTKKDAHGDGTAYASMLEPGAIDRQCTDCHQEVVSNTAHDVHKDKVDCRACHMTSSITCYNCHFESLVQGHKKRTWGGLKGFVLLGKDPNTGKVRPATFMTLTYQGKAFYAVAPYSAHNITAQPRTCSDCHNNENVQAINAGEQIQLAQWDDAQKKVIAAQGVIPIPANWRHVFKLDFLTYNGDPAGDTDPNQWALLKSEADTSQMMYLEPLGNEELTALSETMHDEFYTSLHGTRQGKITWYSAANGGFESLTGIPIQDLGCLSCHPSTYADGSQVDPSTYRPDCEDCHDFSQGYSVSQDLCFGCHGRQKTEIMKLQLSDVHREKGFQCTTCHPGEDVHGDGTRYASMFDTGAIEKSCEDCHQQVPSNVAHTTHTAKVDCKACHLKTVITCYNCHLESLIQGHKKRAWGVLKDYVLLARDKKTGKVTTATFMTLTYQGKTFFAVGPYTAHAVVKKGLACTDCHNNANIQAYNQNGEIVLTRWDDAEKKIINAKGVVPVPPDWKRAFKLDFLTYNGDLAGETDPNQWALVKTGADSSQMLYVEPLTAEQMQKLSTRQ